MWSHLLAISDSESPGKQTSGCPMSDELTRWRQSYKHLPLGAGEDEIVAAHTSELHAAHRLMAQCKRKPPEVEVKFTIEEIFSLLQKEALIPYLEKLTLDACLRYSRVCRELARRAEPETPEIALVFLRSATLPDSCALAFDSHDAYMEWWKRNERAAHQPSAELLGALENVPEILHAAYLHDFLRGALLFGASNAKLQAAFVISQNQDSWNFWVKTSIVAIEERLGHGDEAARLKDECLDLLRFNDRLWSDAFGSTASRSVLALPIPLSPVIPATGTLSTATPTVETLEFTISRVLSPHLEQLLKLARQNLQISSRTSLSTSALHDRMDFVIETLVDLDQRSKLTWRQVSKMAHQEPDYPEMRRGIETSLAARLGSVWGLLKASSRQDLVDSEYVFQHCTRWGSGWRMAALGYCTTAERELRASYKLVVSRLFAVPAGDKASKETLGDLVKLLENFKARLSKHQSLPPGLSTLLDSIGALWKLNDIRIRAAHSTPQELSGDDAIWLKEILLDQPENCLLLTIVAVRLEA